MLVASIYPLRFDAAAQFRNHKIVYRRYAGLFFCICVDANDNELAYLEAIHLFVEVLGVSCHRLQLSRGKLIMSKIRSSTTSVNWISSSTSTRYVPVLQDGMTRRNFLLP